MAAFFLGLVAFGVALVGPVEHLAGERFSWHMVQHLVLTMVAVPLVLLGRPMSLARRATRSGPAIARVLRSRAVRWLAHPVVGLAALAVVLWASHFTSLYSAAVRSQPVHIGEHALYVGAAMLYWLPVLAVEPSPWRLGYGARVLYLFLAGQATALLGAVLTTAPDVLYRPYAGPGALADQRAGGAVMWVGGGLVTLAAVLVVGAAWARHEHQVARRAGVA